MRRPATIAGEHPDGLFGRGAPIALARRPDLWPTAVRVAAGALAPGWWRSWPPRPSVPAGYRHFRHQTMFGSDRDARLGPEELVGYLAWCRQMRR